MKRLTLKFISVICTIILCMTVVFSAAPSAFASTVYLRGTFNSWGDSNEYAMTADNNNHYIITIHLKKGSYEYKAATSDWSTFQAPVEGNESLSIDSDCDVTFVADKASNTILAYPHSSLESGISKVVLKSKWMEHSDLVLIQKGSNVSYQSAGSSYPESAYWNIISNGNGTYYLQNNSTKNYASLSGNSVICVAGESGGNTSWNVDTSTGATRFISAANDKAVINVENLSGNAEASDVPMYFTSSQWSFEYSSYDYTLKPDKVIDTGYNAYADSAKSITSYMTGSKKTWTQSKNLSQYPAFKAENSPLAAAVYNLSLEEAVKNIFTENNTQYFRTGTNWDKVWTRDTALSSLYSLAWVFPEISYNCEYKKVKTNAGVSVFEQDTGSGGSYPVSTDKIITMLSVWENYLTDGNKEHLSYFYDICRNTIMQDMGVAYDKDAGLFRGETCGLDWRDQTYPDWTSETYDSGLSAIAESKTASVNAIYCRVLEIMSKAAKILEKGEDAEQAWKKAAEDLSEKIKERLWDDKLGLYSSWEYPEYMGSARAEKADVLGNGFALWFNIGTENQLNSICENYPVVPYGADTVYPQKQGKLANANKIYHNFGVWPGWDSILMVGANYNNNKALAEEIFNSNVRGAAVSLTNKEVINYKTGEGVESDQQLWSIAGTLAGYYRVMFGMNYDEDGITFKPYIPSWMQGPFELTNFKYRNAVLNINLSGEGDKVKSFKVDHMAKDINSYVFSSGSTGSHTIEIVMEKSGSGYKINKSEDNLVVCPEMPNMTYSNGKLSWTQKNGLTYKLWTGKEYVDVSGGSYTVDKSVYGCYSLMAVSSDGVCSELSKPIVVSPNRIKIEAESGSVSDSSLISSGYVIDKRSKSAKLTLNVTVPKKGKYILSGIYNNSGDATSGISCGIRSVYVDGKDMGSLVFPEVQSSKKNQTSTHLALGLEEGEHTVKIFYDTANWYDRNMSISKNDVEYNYFNFDYAGEIKEEPTEPATEAQSTEAPATEPVTQAQTTEPPTDTEPSETELVTDAPTVEPTTEPVTSAPTEPVTQPAKTKTYMYVPSAEQESAGYNYKLLVNNNNTDLITYELVDSGETANGMKVYKAEVPADFNITQLFYQVYDGDTWISQLNVAPDIAADIIINSEGKPLISESDDTIAEPTVSEQTEETTAEDSSQPVITTPVENDTTNTAADEPSEPVPTSIFEPTVQPDVTPAVTPENKSDNNQTSKPKAKQSKKQNTISVKAKAKTIKLKKLKKKAQIVKPLTVKKAKGKVSYKLIKKGTSKKIRKYIKINKNGSVTVKKWKKAKKGSYKIKVKISAKGNSKYKPKSINKTFKIRIK